MRTSTVSAVGAHTLNTVESSDHVAPKSLPSYVYAVSNSSVLYTLGIVTIYLLPS